MSKRCADELELDLGDVGLPFHLIAYEDLMGPSLVRDPGGDIHGSSEVVSFLDDHRASVDADPSRHVEHPLRSLDQLEAAQDRRARVAEVKHDSVTEPLDWLAATRPRGVLYHTREARSKLGRGFVSAFLRERREAREIQEGDRRRLSRLERGDSPLLDETLRHSHDVLKDRVLPVPALEPGDEAADKLGERRRPLVDEAVLFLVRDLEGPDTFTNRSIEELEP